MTLDLSACVWRLPVAVIDVETTGLPEHGGRVCEIAAVRYEDGLPVSRFASLVNPGHPIPEAATKVHGIVDADVVDKPRLPELAGELLRVCSGAVACAYNAPFDRGMLHAEITGKDCHAFDPEQSWIDPLPMVRHFDRWERGTGRHKLENACKRRGIVLEGAHRALADALATGALLWTFKAKLGDISAADLIKRCEERRQEQDAEFVKWMARRDALNGVA